MQGRMWWALGAALVLFGLIRDSANFGVLLVVTSLAVVVAAWLVFLLVAVGIDEYMTRRWERANANIQSDVRTRERERRGR